MKRLFVLTVVSTLVVGTAGCRQCNWFGRSSGPAMQRPRHMPATTYVVPAATAPATSPASCGPGCNSCGSNTLPILSGAQGYAAAPTN